MPDQPPLRSDDDAPQGAVATQRTPAVRRSGTDDRSWWLHVAWSPDSTWAERNWELSSPGRSTGGPWRIGREASAGRGTGLVVRDPTVSRLHARLQATADGHAIEVQDCDSSNGTFVDGRRVLEATLGDGSVLRVGDTVLVLGHGERPPEATWGDLGLVGRTPVMQQLRTTLRRVAPSRLPALVHGPTGSGKELVARALHTCSGRRGAFVAVNCAALPASLVESMLFGHRRGAFTGATADQDGAFVRAHGGTLFLDEIGDMPLEAQPKLLRALENGEVTPVGAASPVAVDVRIVVATHVPLEEAVAAGRFREDLYARLNGVLIETPPLHARRDDVLLLLHHLLPPAARRVEATADFVEALIVYAWPRNVRELARLAERLPVLHPDARQWRLDMLDPAMQAPLRSRAVPELALPGQAARGEVVEPERKAPPAKEELLRVLDACGGNVSEVAARMGRNRKQVYRWMDQYGIGRGTGR